MAAYLLVHALLYVFLFRTLPAFRSERTIFRYHAGSVLLVGAALLIGLALAPSRETLASAVTVAAAHGIYSVTFLELWALADGSYSLTILRQIAQGTPVDDVSAFEAVGIAKLESRLRGLARMGLVQADSREVALTPRGRLVAGALAAIAALANVRQEG